MTHRRAHLIAPFSRRLTTRLRDMSSQRGDQPLDTASSTANYVGRIAPTPSGQMHIGHAQTFMIAMHRALQRNGKIIMRVEDLDFLRCKPGYLDEMFADLSWLGIQWHCGPSATLQMQGIDDCGTAAVTTSSTSGQLAHSFDDNGLAKPADPSCKRPLSSPLVSHQPAQKTSKQNKPSAAEIWHQTVAGVADSHLYFQSRRKETYINAWKILHGKGLVYPSPHSRKDVENALSAPHEGEIGAAGVNHAPLNTNGSNNHKANKDGKAGVSIEGGGDNEVIFPPSLRPPYMRDCESSASSSNEIRYILPEEVALCGDPGSVNWRFRVTDGEVIEFNDIYYGPQKFIAGVDFGDFVVWRGSDKIASYELAVVADDLDMGVTEIVRGMDLLLSTARQILLYRALGSTLIPAFYHCPLVRDTEGKRLAKRSPGVTISNLREKGYTPDRIMQEYFGTDVLANLKS